MATLEFMPLGWFRIQQQVRKQFAAAELQQLGESLKVKQLQPVLAKPDGTLVAGERRYRAAELAGLKGLWVIVSDEPLSDSEIRILQLAENLHRAELTGYEQWLACRELLTLNPTWLAKDLAEHLKLSAATITRLLSPTACTPAVQEALAEGRIGISDCYAISRVPQAEQDQLLQLKLAGASRDVLEQHSRKQRQAATPAVRTSRVKCALSSGVHIVVSGDALSLDDLIEALSEAQREARRARDQALDVRTFQAVMRDKSQKPA
jgi:ParB family chromosome partitioning protein